MNKNNVFSLMAAICLVVLLPGCWDTCKSGTCGSAATTTEAQSLKTGLFVVNVLDKEFYDDCHIKGSINVPFEQIEQFAQELDKQNAEVVVYCSDYRCSTSKAAYKKLKELGIEKVFAYEAGMTDWFQMSQQDAAYAVEGVCQQNYLNNKVEPVAAEGDSEVATITTQQLKEKMEAVVGVAQQ